MRYILFSYHTRYTLAKFPCLLKHMNAFYENYLIPLTKTWLPLSLLIGWGDLKIPNMHSLEIRLQHLTKELIPFCCVCTGCIISPRQACSPSSHMEHAALAKGSQRDFPLWPLQMGATTRIAHQEKILHCPKISVKHRFQGLTPIYLSSPSAKLSI